MTGSRADFALLQPVMTAIKAMPVLQLQVVTAGLHLLQGTVRDVAAGFAIAGKVAIQNETVGRDADVAALGRGIIGFGRLFAKLKPDVVVVLGDRIEALAAACAASVGGIHLAHIHGGDRAEGVADEAMRHAIGKLAHLHFAATTQSRRRLIRMGESPAWVWNVGSPAVAGLKDIPAATDDQLRALKIDPARPFLMVMQHPCGGAREQERQWMAAVLTATAKHQRIVFMPNHDPGRTGIVQAIAAARIEPVTHLPRAQFIGLLKRASALVGNSSGGLIEASAVSPGGLAVVNVGPRQAGRERTRNVVDAEPTVPSIRRALSTALRGQSFGKRRVQRHPYGEGDAPQRIARLLASADLQAVSIRKRNAY